MRPMKLLSSRTIDRMGIVASTICLLHCLATPLVIALLPFVASAGYESWMLVALIAMASTSAALAAARHDLIPAIPFIVGVPLVVFRRSIPEGSWEENLTTSLAAIALLLTHLLSLRRERAAPRPRLSVGSGGRERPRHPRPRRRPPSG